MMGKNEREILTVPEDSLIFPNWKELDHRVYFEINLFMNKKGEKRKGN